MAATLPHSHLRLHLPLRTPDPSSRRRHRLRLPSRSAPPPPPPAASIAFASSRLQNPTTATHPVLPPPAPAPSAAQLAAEGASLAPRREHRFPGSVSAPTSSAAAGGLAEAEDAVLRRSLEVRRAVAAEALVAALSGGKVGGLTYINNLTALMGPFVDRVVVEAAAKRRDRPDLAHMSFNARAKVYIQEIRSCRASQVQYLKEFGLSNEELGRLLALKPQLMACSIEERWKPLVKYLYHLNVSRDGMKRMLLVQPTIFCLDLETVIAPKVQFLQDIGVRSDAIGNVLVKFPPVLTYSLYKKIRPVVIFLLTKGGVKQDDIGKVIALDPQLLGCSIAHKLEVSVKYFRSLGIYHFVLGQMVADFPALLRYNVDILKPKYQYLRRVMVRPLKDLIEFPRFFSYSLEDRIEPRHQTLVANRINMKLRYMLTGSDEEFAQRVREAVERRARSEAGKGALETFSDAAETSKEEETKTAAAYQNSVEVD